MTIYDGIILLLLIVSGVTGYVRGGAKEIVTLFAFLIAALISALMLPYSGPFFRGFISPQWVGTVVAAVLVFVIAYLAVHGIGGFIRSKLHQSDQLGGVDRTVGLGVGLIRALAIVGAFHLMLAAMTANRIPDWFRHAALYKVSAFSAKTIQVVLPPMARAADSVAPRVEASVREGATGQPQSRAKRPPAYDRRQRQDMDALVERTR